ncbi:Crotonobetainyl-CoA:carnitine CoA-transferase CaiB [Parasphingorhabdus marina DSM 22363]|uniref:Crotonobetainyl-CoA:carnitine CoA-transferase CaiB n=1 Tax=Parasphingorhabdus marina DSM 22363 TaxID=1123272 RepID=A0A1N6HSN4_9SPHN|nr:CaiB/BaiF CoA-transferase family protein [Parasphingorhabdus marina]SIO22665.1 Crotonobetainyl-CoA:carnitine CoA-transferase CaiB [Parasphingorhabdus marina DSM 22363]
MSGFPLAGLKVLDFSRVVAGPYATRMLSDLGAEVLKVEPPEGDVTRKLAKRESGVSGNYLQLNIGKQNICIDLKAEGAKELIHGLAAKADIVVENFRPGIMDRFGIGWKDLSAVNPRLVMLSISGYGQNGPERGRAAYAPVLHAETGLIARQAEMSGGHPTDIQFAMADSYSSLHGIIAILSALRMLDQTGEGQHIDLAMLNVLHSADDYAHFALDNIWPKAPETLVWEAPEKRQILITGDMKWLWIMFSTKDGLADPTPEGADIPTKVRLRREAMETHISGHASFDALTATLDRLNLAWGEVHAFGPEVYEQTSVKALGTIVDVTDDDGNARRTVQSPYRFSKSASGIDSNARTAKRGEHNVSALQNWLGMTEDEIAALAKSGALISE